MIAIVVIASLASAHPSLRPPRGRPHESVLFVPTEAGGPAEQSDRTATDPEIELAGEGEPPSNEPDFTDCQGRTGLDNAICRHEALLVVHSDNHGLQTSLTHLQENRAEHEAKGQGVEGSVPPEHGASSSSSNGHDHGPGQSAESHSNAGNGHDHDGAGDGNGGAGDGNDQNSDHDGAGDGNDHGGAGDGNDHNSDHGNRDGNGNGH